MAAPPDRDEGLGEQDGFASLGDGLLRRGLVDEVSCLRVGDRNRLTMRKRIDP